MSLSPITRKPGFWLSLVVALPTLALGQATYVSNASEYNPAGALAGDQVRPAAALTPLGGWLVWDDNAVDGNGQGIGAMALDSNFQGVGPAFRVNQTVGNDQTRAQVAILQGGGAVIVWQGGAAGRENVYARFLSASNTWLTGDVLVNATAGEYHKNPAVTVLTNGNVVVVWGSYNEQTTTSMQDIYAQVLSPIGQKVGAEFLVNQYTPYNQRNPSIAALNSGGFAVAWVSEQQMRAAADNSNPDHQYWTGVLFANDVRPSVDVYARIFSFDGSAVRDEFLVNTNTNPCGVPVIAASADNRLLVAWAEKDLVTTTNGWDIMVRPISSLGLEGTARRVNTYVVGDQFSPRIAVIGGSAVVVWNSMGQDGSWEGVYGQFLQFDGALVGGEIRFNSTTVGRQIQPSIAGDGTARFLGLWTSFVGATSGLDLFAQKYAATDYVAGPTVASVFAAPLTDPFPIILSPGVVDAISTEVTGGTTNLPADGAPVIAAPATSDSTNAVALKATAGGYNGLVWGTNQVGVTNSGFITLKTTTRATYSGKLLLAGKSYSFAGKFASANGSSPTNALSAKMKAASGGSLELQLQVDLLGGDQISGGLLDKRKTGITNWIQVVADRASNGVVSKGKSFTMAVQPVVGGPVGYSYGTVKINSSGNAQWAGVLADGTKISQTTGISKQGLWPLYASLYGGGGVAISWMQFTNGTDLNNAQFIWIKDGSVPTKYSKGYAGGITNSATAFGSIYESTAGANLLHSPSNVASFYSVAPTNAFGVGFALSARNLASSTNKQFKLKFTAATGVFSGSALQPAGEKISFQGVVYQKGTNGLGLLSGKGDNGQIFIAPAN